MGRSFFFSFFWQIDHGEPCIASKIHSFIAGKLIDSVTGDVTRCSYYPPRITVCKGKRVNVQGEAVRIKPRPGIRCCDRGRFLSGNHWDYMNKGLSLGVITGSTGRWLFSKIARTIEQLAFLGICIKTAVRYRSSGRRLMYRIVVQQIYFTGVQSLELITLLALLFGGLMVVQGITQLSKLGSSDQISTLIIVVLIRELGPLLTAIIITLRSGSAIAMEIGYMNVLGEIEGLEMQGIPTLHFLAIPRLIGVTVSVICLIILFDLIALAGGFLAYYALKGVSVLKFVFDLAGNLRAADFLIVALKGITFGLTIAVVCLYHGFMAQDAITSVPPRVSRALLDCFIYCVIFSILITGSIAF